MSRDHWRITTAAIQMEMERIAGLLEKSMHFHSRTSAAHPLHQRTAPPPEQPATAPLPAPQPQEA